jgi:Rha family phage regulatory protein
MTTDNLTLFVRNYIMETSTVAVQDFTSFVFADGENLKTTSLIVAEKFGKQHKNVLRDIDNLLEKISNEFKQLNFELTDFIDKNGDAQRMYNMTKDGLVILVMGYTGTAAMQVKEAYINAFNFMRDKMFAKKPPYGLKQMSIPSFDDDMGEIKLHTKMFTGEMITQFKHAIDLFARESNLTKHRAARNLAAKFQADNWKVIPIENYPKVCAYLGIKPLFMVESTNDIAIVEGKRYAQLERENLRLRMELEELKQSGTVELVVKQAMQDNILKISDAIDDLSSFAA